MTTKVCKIEENKIHFVADTRVTQGFSQKADIRLEKIIEHNDIYIGLAGDAAIINFLDIFIRTNLPSGNTLQDIVLFAHKFFLYAKEMTTKTSFDSDVILIFKGKVYVILLHQLGVFEIDKYFAIGSGSSFATAALHLGKTAEEAVELACKLDAFSELPLQKYIIRK